MLESPESVNLSAADEAGPFDYDLAIVGAGPVGLALTGWLARRSGSAPLSVALIDAREPSAALDDPRALALSHGSRMLLETLCWPSDATPIKRIHISQRGHFGRTLIDHREHDLAALGYVVRYGPLLQSLAEAVRGTPSHWLTRTSASAPRQEAGGVRLSIEQDGGSRDLRVRLLINAEGGLYRTEREPAGTAPHAPSGPESRRLAAPGTTRDYGQTALVGIVSVSAPQPNVAWERFTNEGPVALLPCSSPGARPYGGTGGNPDNGQNSSAAGGPGNGAHRNTYALVWCATPAQTARRLELPDEALLAELGEIFGSRLGRFERIVGRATFPLGLNALDTLVDGRIAAIGNAAQTLHPVAGQGLNLGLRDAYALVEALAVHGPTEAALASFARRRAADRRLTIGATDALARGFRRDTAALACARGLALTALDWLPPVKNALARQMIFGQRR